MHFIFNIYIFSIAYMCEYVYTCNELLYQFKQCMYINISHTIVKPTPRFKVKELQGES